MEEKQKRNWKEEIKDTWTYCRPYIKTALACLCVGWMYGFIKGMDTNNEQWLKYGFERARDESEENERDDFVYDETTVDDPELLELIRMENENS